MSHTPSRQQETRSSRAWWIVLPAAIVLTLLFYRHIALSNRILSGVDAFTYFYPYRDYAARAIREGSIPLWNPYLFLGAPFLANPQTAVFYPLNLVLAWLVWPQDRGLVDRPARLFSPRFRAMLSRAGSASVPAGRVSRRQRFRVRRVLQRPDRARQPAQRVGVVPPAPA